MINFTKFRIYLNSKKNLIRNYFKSDIFSNLNLIYFKIILTGSFFPNLFDLREDQIKLSNILGKIELDVPSSLSSNSSITNLAASTLATVPLSSLAMTSKSLIPTEVAAVSSILKEDWEREKSALYAQLDEKVNLLSSDFFFFNKFKKD